MAAKDRCLGGRLFLKWCYEMQKHLDFSLRKVRLSRKELKFNPRHLLLSLMYLPKISMDINESNFF